MSITIRRAGADDQDRIRALVRQERLNPNDLHWPNFIVAEADKRLIAAAQIRRHPSGARELGSLVVDPAWRGQGLAGTLVAALLADKGAAVFMITGRDFAVHYARWGFAPIRARHAPASVRRNYLLGQTIGGLHALATCRPINRLVILKREAYLGENGSDGFALVS